MVSGWPGKGHGSLRWIRWELVYEERIMRYIKGCRDMIHICLGKGKRLGLEFGSDLK